MAVFIPRVCNCFIFAAEIFRAEIKETMYLLATGVVQTMYRVGVSFSQKKTSCVSNIKKKTFSTLIMKDNEYKI